MCYHVRQSGTVNEFMNSYNAPPTDEVTDELPYYHVGGFVHPKLTMLSQYAGHNRLEKMQWGLIPNWKKPYADMLKMSNNTLNAKSETIFELASFKNSIMKFRGILPVNGFYEYKHVDVDKLPYFIHPKNQPFFNLGCIYSFYENPETKEKVVSFSIITTEANELMADIHNSKKRMPLTIDDSQINNWLNPNASKEEVKHLMEPCDDRHMAAYRVNRDLLKIGNKPEVFARIDI